jgi:arylsulfatase A-like enzyme
MALKEYKPGMAFPGVIGRTIQESSPAWPEPLRSKPDAPNVIYIVLDDTGFGQLGCFGGPINTPNLDRLAENGLRYNNMHTTALCSPSRSCFITGRNHHSNAMSCITEGATGFPGSNGNIPFENGFLSEILQQNGYSTFCLGKWHLTPAEQMSAAGPYDRWPLGRGFDRYYGFIGADTHQYYPDLVYDNHRVDPPKTPEQGYHLSADLADKAIEFVADLKQTAPDKPFFMYFAPGANHAPHHVPQEWADKYKGKFDDGWDAFREKVIKRQLEDGVVPKGTVLSAHDPDVQDWGKLPANERKLYARMMEVFAGFCEHVDYHIGRLLNFLERLGELDNTLVMVISDNGASAEGGPHGSINENLFFNNIPETAEEGLKALPDLGGPLYFNHYPFGWTFAGNTPFRRWKRETYRGGVSDPFIISWPKGMKARGEVRTQFCHAIDMMPTVLDALGIEPPMQIRGVSQSPIQGISLKDTFDNPNAENKHKTQYFEMFGHRSIYHNGWRAVCPYPGPSFSESTVPLGTPIDEKRLRELDAKGWELYHVDEDFSETKNLAQTNRDKLIEMIAIWYVEAGKYNVLPIDSRLTMRLTDERPQLAKPRLKYNYYPGTSSVPEFVAVKVLNRPHAISARVEIPKGGAEGVILSHGGNTGGYSLFVKDKKLHYVHNYCAAQEFLVSSEDDVPEGAVELRFEFAPTGKPDLANGKGTPGRVQLYINGKRSGQAEIPVTIPLMVGIAEGLECGRDSCSSVTKQYPPPFPFTGIIHDVVVDVSGDLIEDKDAAMRTVMARQ